MNRSYAVYKLFNQTTGDKITEFFSPEKTGRIKTLQDYKRAGYSLISNERVDIERYLNLKIDNDVEEYVSQDKHEVEIRNKYESGKTTERVYIDTLKLIEEYRGSCLRKLKFHLSWLQHRDFDCTNETAIELYNSFILAQV